MTINRKVTGTASGIPSGLAVGVFAALTTMLTGAFAIAFLIQREILDWNHTGYAAMVLLIFTSWIGAAMSAEKIKRRRLMACAASGTAYFIVLLAITGLFFGGNYSGVGESALLIFCGSMLGFFVKSPEKTRGNIRKIRKRHG